MVRNIGAEIEARFHYPDHYVYHRGDLKTITKRCQDLNIDIIVTTEKDAVRLKRLKDVSWETEILALRIDFKITTNEEIIASGLRSVFNS